MQTALSTVARSAAHRGASAAAAASPRVRSPPHAVTAPWRLLASRTFVAAAPRYRDQPESPAAREPTRVAVNADKGTPIGQVVDRRLRVVFTCTAPKSPEHPDVPCHHRSSHEFSKSSYEKGVVIVQCPECNNRHLIADHLHWFSQTPSPAHPQGQAIGSEQPRTIEQLMREKGEQVRWTSSANADAAAAAEGGGGEGGQVKMVVRERTEEDGGKTVEVVPESETSPTA